MTRDEYLKLVDDLNYHSLKYYAENAPVISDEEYDGLYKKLEQHEAENPDMTVPYSPTQQVGAKAVSRLESVTHEVPMLSLNNTYTKGELQKFIDDVCKEAGGSAVLTVEPKIDGLAISLTYENGELVQAATRGDGKTGEDVTHNMLAIPYLYLPKKIDYKGKLIVRGEVYMPLESFNNLNKRRVEAGLSEFANPRNSAAGALKLLDSKESHSRGLRCFVFGIDAGYGDSYFEDLMRLKKLGFPVNEDISKCDSAEKVFEAVENIHKKRSAYPYEIDGAVIKVDAYSVRDDLGYTIKAPKWAIAFKYPSEAVHTKLLDVKFQVGRTGAVSPVAVLEPVLVSGSTVSRATLNNEDYIKSILKEEDGVMHSLMIGDEVSLVKGGDVIPKIVGLYSVGDERSEIVYPDDCPVCGSTLKRFKVGAKQDSDESLKRCVNSDCPAIVKETLKHFVSKNAMDIAGLGESILVKLMDTGSVKSPADLYYFDYDKLKELDGFGEKSVEKLKEALEKSKEKPFEKVLFALGIRNVGVRTAEILAEKFQCLEGMQSASVEELTEVGDIGDITAQYVFQTLHDGGFNAGIDRLKSAGLKFKIEENVNYGTILNGKTFLFTGKLEKPRKYYEELVKQNGGSLLSTVSKNLDYLIVGEKAGSKLAKAEKLGINILSVDDFINMIGEGE